MFSTIDRLISKVAPVDQLVDGVLARILPQAQAAACGTPYFCESKRGNYCYWGCVNGLAYKYWDEKKYYRPYSGASCYVECTDSCDWWERYSPNDHLC